MYCCEIRNYRPAKSGVYRLTLIVQWANSSQQGHFQQFQFWINFFSTELLVAVWLEMIEATTFFVIDERDAPLFIIKEENSRC